MANGTPTFAELYSGANIGNRIGAMSGSLDMFKRVLADVSGLEKLEDLYEDKLADRGKQSADREKKRGKGRTLGAILGGAASIFLTGGLSAIPLALGVGAGSYVGQRVTDGGVSLRTPFGDQRRARLKDIERGNTSNIFFRQDMARKLEKSRNKMNDYLRSANDRYDQSIIASAMSDTLTAYQLGGLDYSKAIKQVKNLKHLPAVAKGDMSVQTFRGLQDMAAGKDKGKILTDRFGIKTKAPTAVKKLTAPKLPYKEMGRLSLDGTKKQDLFNKVFNISKSKTSMSPFRLSGPANKKTYRDFMFGGDTSNLSDLLTGLSGQQKLNIRDILGSGMQKKADLKGILSYAYPSEYFKVD